MELTIKADLLSDLTGKEISELEELLLQDGDSKDFKEDAPNLFNQLVKDKFLEIERERAFKAHQKGVKEKAQSIDAVLKPLFEKHKIKGDTTEEQIELLIGALDKIGADSKRKPADLDKEALQKLPLFQQLVDLALDGVRQEKETLQTEFDTYKSEITLRDLYRKVKKSTLKLLKDSNAVLAEDADAQVQFFLDGIGVNNVKYDDKGLPTLVDEEGNPYRDPQTRNKISFPAYILDRWKKAGYRFHDAPPGNDTPKSKRPGEGGAGGSAIVITSEEEYEKLLKAAGNDREKKAEIRAAYRKYLISQSG